MVSFIKNKILNHPVKKIYNLVANVKKYPEFLPWCRDITIKKKTKLVNEIISASNKSKFDKMETLLKVILKLGTCELFYFKNIPINVSLSQLNV